MAEEPLKTLWLGAHATCTACPPHFNLSCQSLSAKQFIHSWGAGKKPFLCCLLGNTQDLFRSFSASAVSPLAGMLDYCSMTHGWCQSVHDGQAPAGLR